MSDSRGWRATASGFAAADGHFSGLAHAGLSNVWQSGTMAAADACGADVTILCPIHWIRSKNQTRNAIPARPTGFNSYHFNNKPIRHARWNR
ncbi:MAG: hypothetical protein ABI589_05700 [Burkholderiales bacterium]